MKVEIYIQSVQRNLYSAINSVRLYLYTAICTTLSVQRYLYSVICTALSQRKTIFLERKQIKLKYITNNTWIIQEKSYTFICRTYHFERSLGNLHNAICTSLSVHRYLYIAVQISFFTDAFHNLIALYR